MRPFLELPDEILAYIFSFLNSPAIAQVSSKANRLYRGEESKILVNYFDAHPDPFDEVRLRGVLSHRMATDLLGALRFFEAVRCAKLDINTFNDDGLPLGKKLFDEGFTTQSKLLLESLSNRNWNIHAIQIELLLLKIYGRTSPQAGVQAKISQIKILKHLKRCKQRDCDLCKKNLYHDRIAEVEGILKDQGMNREALAEHSDVFGSPTLATKISSSK